MPGSFFRRAAVVMAALLVCFAAVQSAADKVDINVWKNSAEIEIFGKEKIHPGDSHTYTMKLLNTREFDVSFDIYAKAKLTIDGKTDTSIRLPMSITFKNPGADGIKRNVSDLFTTDELGVHVGHGELFQYNRAYIDVCWEWPFHVSAETDKLDTMLSRHDTRLTVTITTVSEADPNPDPVPTPEPESDVVIDLTGGDEFIIYDTDMKPESYYLTEYLHTKADLRRNAGETGADFERRVLRYQSENPDIFLFESMPDMRADDKGAEIPVTDEHGRPVYSERRMVLTGEQIEKLIDTGIDEIIFRNGDSALRIEPEMLLSSLIAPAYRELSANVREHREADRIAIDIVNEKMSGQRLASLLKAEKVSDKASEKDVGNTAIPALTIFPKSVFEFTIIPLNTEKLLRMANREHEPEEKRQAAEKLTDDELALLKGLLMREGIFDGTEEELRDKLKTGGLISSKQYSQINGKYGWKPACSVRCRLIYGDRSADITGLVQMKLLTALDAAELNKAASSAAAVKPGIELKKMEYIRFDNGSAADSVHEKSAAGNQLPAEYDEIGPNRDSDFYEISAGKDYPRLDVRVRDNPDDPDKPLTNRSFVKVRFDTQPFVRYHGVPGGIFTVART